MTASPSHFGRRREAWFTRVLMRLAPISLLVCSVVALAGVATAQDHFRVYPVVPGEGIDGPIVQIDDQFGTQVTDLSGPLRFMVPASKNAEPIFDFFSHLTCYQILDGAAGPAVISTNQFGVQPLTLGVPDSLCVPTEKLIAPGPVSLDHYKCYEAAGAQIDAGVALQDQFGQTSAIVLNPRLFCTPADKNGEGIADPITHLTCYDTTPPGIAPGPIPILNQFTAAPDLFTLLEADMLCAPSTKEVAVPKTDHFQGYPTLPGAGLSGPIVQLVDQFGSQTTDLGRPVHFLVPADKDSEGIEDPISHLTCYEIVDGVAGPQLISTNQFGAQPLTLGVPDSLCVPTEKLITPGPVDLDHYKCYEAAGAQIDLGVSVQDQFQSRSTLLGDPKLFCTPVDKNGEGIDDPDTHLTCYDTTPVGQAPGLIPILNQFVAVDQVLLDGPNLLCAPSTKEVVPPVEHFLVYNADGPDGPPVTLEDQFGSQTTDLGLTSLFMVPVDKNDEGIFDPFTHLTCYSIDDGFLPPPRFRNVKVTNQFVTDQDIEVGLASELCVPTEKLIAPGPIDGDHYRCWEASDPSGSSLGIGVDLVDQFQGFATSVMDPYRLCNPVDKNGEGIQDEDSHLVCYTLQPQGSQLGIPIPVQNQFFSLANIDVNEPFALCAPSVKTVPEPSVPPMADGVTGSPLRLSKGAGGSLTVTYDAATCSADRAVLLWGEIGEWATYSGDVGAGCDAGAAGSADFEPPDGSVWFNLLWVSPSGAAGHPGFSSQGARTLQAAGLCGVTSDDTSDTVCD